ncbi:MAG TPA: lysozyme inhibitor LprI family protein [Bacteroidia bacterium]|jgi:uncharacterized protein YecT (DUF1311 family)|nr:lysozyme inhibitor LprI family protein [Bacteroidia bacterium]
MKHFLSILISLFITLTAFGQKSDVIDSNLIDKRLKACLDSTENQTTLGMIGCTAEAEQLWDAEMNKYYKLLKGVLTPEEMEKLKAAQIKWIVFRDAEFSASNKIYADMQGTMWRIVAVDTQMEIVKQRALELKSYYDNLSAK